MEAKAIYLNIYSQEVVLRTSCIELVERIQNDFFHFVVNGIKDRPSLEINSHLERPNFDILKNKKIWRNSKNSKTYDDGNIRYNDYHGKLLSIYDYNKCKATLKSENLNKLHEITYLLILSITGKNLDLLGLHKIHAFSVVYNDICLVGMMKMGTGKSTMLSYLISDPKIKILSDDTPLVDSTGKLHAFPLRLGFNEPCNLLSNIEPYILEREFYGKKYLYSFKDIKNPIAQRYKKVIFFEATREGNNEFSYIKSSPLCFLSSLIYHMVIGFGLPLIFEYFWRSGIKDFFRKTEIAFKRFKCAFNLINKHEFYRVQLSQDPEKNNLQIKRWLNSLN